MWCDSSTSPRDTSPRRARRPCWHCWYPAARLLRRVLLPATKRMQSHLRQTGSVARRRGASGAAEVDNSQRFSGSLDHRWADAARAVCPIASAAFRPPSPLLIVSYCSVTANERFWPPDGGAARAVAPCRQIGSSDEQNHGFAAAVGNVSGHDLQLSTGGADGAWWDPMPRNNRTRQQRRAEHDSH